MNGNRVLKLTVLLAFIVALGVAYYLRLHESFTFERLKAQQALLQGKYHAEPFRITFLFFLTYVSFTAISVPGSLVLSLAAGAVFGTLWGSVLVSFASTIGATLAFWFARFVFRDSIQRHWGIRLTAINEGFKRDGVTYLFTLRLIPLFPFFLINLSMGLVPISTATYFWVSQLGMLPATVLYVHAGTALGAVHSPDDILSTNLVVSLTLIGLLPSVAKFIVKKWRTRCQ